MKAKKSRDNGDKTKKQRLLQPMPTTSGITGVGRPMLQGTRRAAPEKVTPIAAKEIDSGAGASKKLKKSNVSVPVPGKKKRKRRLKRYDNGGKTNKDSVRTDTLERSVDQVYANARREEEEIAKEKANSSRNNSGTTSGYRNVGRPLTTARPGAPAKVKTLGPKKIDSGVSMDKTLKKSTAKISAPAEKKRKRRLRRRK